MRDTHDVPQDVAVPAPSHGRRAALRQAFDQVIEQIAYHHSEDLERCWNILLDMTGRRQQYAKLESWMEKRLLKMPWLSPTRLAGEARYYCKMPMEMKPFLIILARRVQTRIRMRRFRVRLAADVAMAQVKNDNEPVRRDGDHG